MNKNKPPVDVLGKMLKEALDPHEHCVIEGVALRAGLLWWCHGAGFQHLNRSDINHKRCAICQRPRPKSEDSAK